MVIIAQQFRAGHASALHDAVLLLDVVQWNCLILWSFREVLHCYFFAETIRGAAATDASARAAAATGAGGDRP